MAVFSIHIWKLHLQQQALAETPLWDAYVKTVADGGEFGR